MKALRALVLATTAWGCTLHVNNPEIASRNQLDVRANAVVTGEGTLIVAPAPSSVSAPVGVAATQIPPQASTDGTASATPTPAASSEPQAMVSPVPTGAAAPSTSPETPIPTSLAALASPVAASATPATSPSITLPTPAPSPVATATRTPDPRYRPPSFVAIRSFSSSAVYQVLDYATVVVADGTTIHVTIDAGASWSEYPGVGVQHIRSMSWISAEEGWVVGSSGALLKVTLSAGRAETVLQDIAYYPINIHFKSAAEGFLAGTERTGGGKIWRTLDGGKTWGNGVAMNVGANQMGGEGSAFLSTTRSDLVFRNQWDALYAYRAGGFMKVEVPGSSTSAGSVAYGESRAIVGTLSGTPIAYTDDWQTFTSIDKDIRTPNQIVRSNVLKRIYPLTSDIWLGVLWKGEMTFTRDAGKVWMEPSATAATDFLWLRPFSETRMWARRDSTLYRAGAL